MNITPDHDSTSEPVIYLDGSTVPKVYDFANGPDEAPEPQMVNLPTWPGFVAHTRHPGDGPIYMFEARAYGPADPVDLRCSGCKAATTIAFDEPNQVLLFVIGHQEGCEAIEDLIEMAS
jgi:hypothetical protein